MPLREARRGTLFNFSGRRRNGKNEGFVKRKERIIFCLPLLSQLLLARFFLLLIIPGFPLSFKAHCVFSLSVIARNLENSVSVSVPNFVAFVPVLFVPVL